MNKNTLLTFLGLTGLVGCAAETSPPTEDVQVQVVTGDEKKTEPGTRAEGDETVVDEQACLRLHSYGLRPQGCGGFCW